MSFAWRKLWPDCAASRDFEGFDTEDFAVVDDIVSLSKNMSLEINNENVELLLEDHKNNLSTEELKQIEEQQQETIADEMSSDEEEEKFFRVL
jgi:hypothetical protein